MNNTTDKKPLTAAEKDEAAFVEKIELIEQEVMTDAWLTTDEDNEGKVHLIQMALTAAQDLLLFARKAATGTPICHVDTLPRLVAAFDMVDLLREATCVEWDPEVSLAV
ncbi:hypothetical protein EJC49_04665 [Aquibium carbonis]|uniref:Uncharacterized protein n=1 Tax=Aquibium carbonis TaxID=2495581 RepID=A0A429Z1L9_9HYPH|nr:hypothetical protein [Aquibium carbonis]RST87520.1 hypothetical protein EJC49_04665 [Aquibium carbonis]